jgi:hypothetical protein
VQAAATASASAHVFLAVLGVYVIHTNIFFTIVMLNLRIALTSGYCISIAIGN